MQGHMNAPLTETVVLSFAVPPTRVEEVMQAMKGMGFEPARDSVPWREALAYSDAELPGVLLSGARYREGLTQVQLADKTGIPRRHISEMENGKRPIGKKNARLLAKALSIDPRHLLSV